MPSWLKQWLLYLLWWLLGAACGIGWLAWLAMADDVFVEAPRVNLPDQKAAPGLEVGLF